MSGEASTSVTFGEFRFDALERTLWRNGESVPLPPKASDILALLIERNGQIVARQEILETIWKDTFVEEGNINYTISLLRKTLGDKDIIQTIPRRGYRFSADLGTDRNGSATLDVSERPDATEMATRRPRRRIYWPAAILGLLVCSAAAAFFWVRNSQAVVPPSSRNIRTLAVLPLRDLTANNNDVTVSLALTDSLISRLGALRRFVVRPFSAVERFAKGKKDSIEIGIELKCDAVLVGTYQNETERMRVNLRLIDVRDGSQLWTSAFDAASTDIFSLQDQIAVQVAGSLLDDLSQSDEELLEKKYTSNRDAYYAYLRGRTIFNRRVENGFQQSLDEYQKALALDPAYPLAYTGLADLFSRQGNGASGAEAAEHYKNATAYIKRALELDNDLSEAHASLGRLKRVSEWDWPGAEREFKRAVDLDPNNAVAMSWYAQMLAFLGRHGEARIMINRAIEIDPVTPSVADVKFPILEAAGELDEGLKLAEERYNFDKQNQTARRALATFLFHAGQYERAVSIAEETIAMGRGRDHVWCSLLAAAYSKMNQPDKAGEQMKQLEEISVSNSKAVYSLAIIYSELGRTDEAIAALERCYDEREERLVWMNVEPRLASIRHDARFHQLLERMQLVRS